jgi:hypothetical protein
VTCGNGLAAEWLDRWAAYCHAIDDLIDEKFTPEGLLAVLAGAVELYSHPFYHQFSSHLRPAVLMVTNAYADSVGWENSPNLSRRRMADVLRLAGVELTIIVAGICGGWAHMRTVSQKIREETWNANHDEAGLPH